MEIEHDWATEFREFRLEHDLSQVGLAAALGLGTRTIWGIENGRNVPRYTSRKRFKALRKRYQEEKKDDGR